MSEEELCLDLVGAGFRRHALSPAFQARLDHPHGLATGVGQCGDAVEVGIRVEDETILDIGAAPRGCAFTVACASALATLVRGLTLEEALNLGPQDIERELGGLPEDHRHCARLAVNTLGEAIEDHLRRSRLGAAASVHERRKA